MPQRRIVILAICHADVARLCSNVPSGRERILECLGAQAASLSEGYRAVGRVNVIKQRRPARGCGVAERTGCFAAMNSPCNRWSLGHILETPRTGERWCPWARRSFHPSSHPSGPWTEWVFHAQASCSPR
jgi:hypothetical protein